VPLTRRDVCLAGVGVPLVSLASVLLARRASEHAGAGSPSARAALSAYRSSLVEGHTPHRLDWDGQRWSADMGSTWNEGMDHCFRFTERKAWFEIRPTLLDRAEGDPPDKRRSELHCTRTRLPNGVPLWGAMSFNHHRWSDPAGMAAQDRGGVHGQIHMGKFGGSPAVAFRRTRDGQFLITTRGEHDPQNNRRWTGPVAFDQVHDLVYRVRLHPTEGELDVWLNGRRVVSLTRASIGSHLGGCYWCIGCYYSAGVTCPIVAEYASHEFPSARDLSARIAARPEWPAA
jgi:hypothetical protein